MRTKTFTLFVLFLFSLISVQAKYTVTLKVIDPTLGEKTNDTDEHTDTNIYVWISDELSEQNPRNPSDWWYPMYNNSGITPDGNLIKGENSWDWTLTLDVAPGEYEWNPYIKSYGWKKLKEAGLANYAGDSDNLLFTVAEDGTITGDTEVIILESPVTTYEVTLSIVDRTKGEITNGTGELNEKNVFIWISGNLNITDDWGYPMYDMEGTTGELVKSDNSWTWKATFSAQPGTYEWNPYLGSTAEGENVELKEQDIPGLEFPANEGGNLEFVVAADGAITGTTSLVIPADGSSIVTENSNEYQVYPTRFTDKVYVNGVGSSVELYDTAGIKVLSVKAKSSTELNTASLGKGIYFLVIDGHTLHKIIK